MSPKQRQKRSQSPEYATECATRPQTSTGRWGVYFVLKSFWSFALRRERCSLKRTTFPKNTVACQMHRCQTGTENAVGHERAKTEHSLLLYDDSWLCRIVRASFIFPPRVDFICNPARASMQGMPCNKYLRGSMSHVGEPVSCAQQPYDSVFEGGGRLI